MNFELIKISLGDKVFWLKVPCEDLHSTYQEFLTAVEKKINETDFILTDEDSVIIEADTFDCFRTKIICIKRNAELTSTRNFQDLEILTLEELSKSFTEENGSDSANKPESSQLQEPHEDLQNSGTQNLPLDTSQVQEPHEDLQNHQTQNSPLDTFNLQAEVESIPGGIELIEEYNKNKKFEVPDRKKLVNIIVFLMKNKYGPSVPKSVKMQYAGELIKLFPAFKDKHSEYGYEEFYDPKTGLGFFTNRLKTLNKSKTPKKKSILTAEENEITDKLVSEEEVQENFKFLKVSDPKTQKDEIIKAMKVTFSVRREKPTEILTDFPRFLDTPNLINLDFSLMYPEIRMKDFSTARILEVYGKITEIQELKKRKKGSTENNDEWNNDTQALLCLLKQIPPTNRRRKRDTSTPMTDIPRKLIVFLKTGVSLGETKLFTPQPCLVAVGPRKSVINSFYIALEGQFIPTASNNTLEAFDELFKSHFVFNTNYDEDLNNFYRFIEIVFYSMKKNGDLTPKMREIRRQLTVES